MLSMLYRSTLSHRSGFGVRLGAPKSPRRKSDSLPLFLRELTSAPQAKTIDLCNNPLHKEPKLDMAKR
jgi:hypothetical protein